MAFVVLKTDGVKKILLAEVGHNYLFDIKGLL